MESVLGRIWPEGRMRVELHQVSDYETSKLLYGHMVFGLHRHLAGESTYVGLVRHPVERVVSSYYFMREQEKHPYHELCLEHTLDETLDMDIPYLKDNYNNHQTRVLAGLYSEVYGTAVPVECEKKAEITSADCRRAVRNIRKHFCFMGALESMYRFSNSMFRILGSNHPDRSWPHVGPTSGRVKTKDIDPVVRNKIAHMNYIDMHLYHYVLRRMLYEYSR